MALYRDMVPAAARCFKMIPLLFLSEAMQRPALTGLQYKPKRVVVPLFGNSSTSRNLFFQPSSTTNG